MRVQYKVAILLLILAQIIFFLFAAYNIEAKPNSTDNTLVWTIGYSWIWYHPEQWMFSLVFSFIALIFFIYGLILDFK